MRLILRILSYKGMPLADAMQVEFTELGGSVGRKVGNTMVLADSEQIVSGRHAEIVFENNAFQIKDTSTNGTLLLKSGIELKHNAAPLTDDEMLRIGEYELGVQILGDPSFANGLGGFQNMPSSGPVVTDPFANLFEAPPTPPIHPQTPAEFPGVQPLFTDLDSFAQQESLSSGLPVFKEQPPSSPFQDSFVPPAISSVQTPDTDIADFLKGLDAIDSRPISDPWLPDNLESASSQTPSTISAFADVQNAVEATPSLAEPIDAFLSAIDAIADVVPPVVDKPAAILGETVALQPETTSPTPPVTANLAQQETELIKLFLNGAGINDASFLQQQSAGDTMQSVGRLFRALVEGLMEVLRARAEMKSEFRVSVTTLRSLDNNPLKFNPDVESVLKLLISPKNPAFTDADTAVKEAFKDIKFHQLAVTAGIQASLAEILTRFNPDSFEQRLGEGLIFQKKSRCWELYCEQYPELKNLATDEFFGDQFAEAYEKQMLLLSKRPQ